MGDPLDKVTNSLTTVIVAIVVICSVLIPIALGQIDALIESHEDAERFKPLIEAIIFIALTVVIVGVVRGVSNREDR